MTGVEILAIEEIIVDELFNWDVAAFSFAIMFCIFLLFGVIIGVGSRDQKQIVVGMILGVMFGIVVGLVGGSAEAIPTEYETQYKVTISDEVFMNDFLERYEIVDQEGKIYTVRERDGETE